jgi:hypothetical protein
VSHAECACVRTRERMFVCVRARARVLVGDLVSAVLKGKTRGLGFRVQGLGFRV